MVSNAAAAAQASCNKLLNLAVGSVTRSVIEAAASLGLWLQFLIVQLWLSERLATSTGADVDSFVGDFGLTRLPAVASVGTVTFSRFTASISSLIVPYFNADGSINPNGVQVLTADLSQTFGVIVNTSLATWNQVMGGYFLPSGTLTIDVPVQALVPGSAGNVQANAISLITTAVSGVDTVNNITVFSDGADSESDAALKARFAIFIATRARATLSAVANAIQTVQQGLSYAIIENTLPTGVSRPGYFTVTVDDGTGSPPTSLITAVYASIDQVRPIGSAYAVQPPAVINAVVNMTISALPGYTKATLQGLVAASIETFINTLGIGQALSYTRLSALAFGVTGVANVSNVLLNNGTADLGGGPTQVVKATGASVVIN
jgi:phage-related baseplate assembly protein